MRVWPLKDTGGVMDIQEEKADFEAEFRKTDFYKMNLVNCFCFINDRYVWDEVQAAWEMWQASKAQAVPEGFVLVPKKPDVDKAWNIALKRIVPPPKINDVVQKELMCKKYVDDLCFEQDRILLNYEEMIEAQEQSHENG